MIRIPERIEVENIFGDHSSDRIDYNGIDGYPIYDSNNVEAFISYGFTLPKNGGHVLEYNKDIILNLSLEINDNTSGLDQERGSSLLGEIKTIEFDLGGETITLEEPFKLQGKGSSRALYLYVIMKREFDALIAADKVAFRINGTSAYFEDTIDAEAFHLYSVLFSKIIERRRGIMSLSDEVCFNLFPDLSSINEELSGDPDLEKYERLSRKSTPSLADLFSGRDVPAKENKESSKKKEEPASGSGPAEISGDRLDLGGGYYYIGEVKEGKPDGKGTIFTQEGIKREEGTYKDGELNGFGITYVDGEKFYEGHFLNGEKSGLGAYYSLGNLVYEGEFLHDKRNGKGTEWYLADHSKYVGEFKDDKVSGKGVFYVNGIKRYEGDFFDGKFHGEGTLFDDKGNVSYSGKLVEGKLPYETVPMKGNNWISTFYRDKDHIAESYKLTFDLVPHTQDLKDNLELYLRYIDTPSDKVSVIALYAHFTSRGKNIFIMGGYPADLRYGEMAVRFNGDERVVIKPIDVSHEMSTSDGSIDEVAAYKLDKDTLKSICDGNNISIILTGSSEQKWTLTGPEVKFLLRAFWNGVFNENDYASFLQKSPNAPQLSNSPSQGCYVATAVYGSYDCPEVWTLRRFRDNVLDRSLVGRAFIRLYYAVSPTLVRLFGDTKVFKALLKKPLDYFVASLNSHGVDDSPYADKY